MNYTEFTKVCKPLSNNELDYLNIHPTVTEIKIQAIEEMIDYLNKELPFPNVWSAEIVRKYVEKLRLNSIDNQINND